MFFTFSISNFILWFTFICSSANPCNFDQSKNLSFGKEITKVVAHQYDRYLSLKKKLVVSSGRKCPKGKTCVMHFRWTWDIISNWLINKDLWRNKFFAYFLWIRNSVHGCLEIICWYCCYFMKREVIIVSLSIEKYSGFRLTSWLL